MKRKEHPLFYRVRIFITAVAMLFAGGLVTYVLFTETGRKDAFGNAFARQASATELKEEAGAVPVQSIVSDTGRAAFASVDPAPAEAGQVSRSSSRARSATARPPSRLEAARLLVAASDWPRAIAIYDSLRLTQPEDDSLAVERARVLAWSGNPAAAAAALGEVFARGAEDPALRIEQASFYWWAADFARADSVLWLARGADIESVDSLRLRIRGGADPSVDLARQWLATNDSGLERLLLARALARSGSAGESIVHYQQALRMGQGGDSLALELASIAANADSLVAAADALESFLALSPGDLTARRQLASYYAWAGRTEEALEAYVELLRFRNDPSARFEYAQLLAWSDRTGEATSELRQLLLDNPGDFASLKLLGDLALWSGDWEGALSAYAAVESMNPTAEGLAEGKAAADILRLAARTVVAARQSWQVGIESFADSEMFRWVAARASRVWQRGSQTVQVAIDRSTWGGDRPGAPGTSGGGLGIDLTGTTGLRTGMTLSGQVGFRTLGSGINLPTWGARMSYEPRARQSLVLEYARQPAIRRAATLASWQGRTVSDLVQLTAARPVLGFDLWTRTEIERLTSAGSGTGRLSSTLAASRPLGYGLTASGVVAGLATDGASPILAGWGPLYWSPARYGTVTAGIAYATPASDTWRASAKIAPGYVWIRERDTLDRRFPSTRASVLALSGEAAYRIRGWELGASADWNGAIRSGYRAGIVRLQLSQPLGDR